MTTPVRSLPEIASAAAAGKETTHNEANRRLEQGSTRFLFKDRGLLDPPASPNDGDCYLLPNSGTLLNDWSTASNGDIAFYLNTAWEFETPKEGMRGFVQDEDVEVIFDGTSWDIAPGGEAVPYSITIALSDLTTDLHP